MSIKTVLPFFSVHVLTLFCIITPISGILDLYCIMENLKKNREKNNSKLRVMCPKNHEHFKNIKSSSNFTGSYEKNSLSSVYITLWKNRCLYTCICSYGFYLSLKAFMVTITPLIRNWKTLNIFRPVENVEEINTKPKYFVYVSLNNSLNSNKLQLRIIFHTILKQKYQN